jgi:Domain of unknown function (DUF4136)
MQFCVLNAQRIFPMISQRHFVCLAALTFSCVMGCTSIDVKTDFDETADFTKFRTFAFAGMTDLNQAGVLSNSLMRKRIESAIARELTKKGLNHVELDQNPDLLVHYWMGITDKETIDTTGPSMGAYGWHGRYGYGAGYTGVTTYEYRQGTLITDLIESSTKELVWRATMAANLEDTPRGNIELGNQAITEAFEKYPPSRSKR